MKRVLTPQSKILLLFPRLLYIWKLKVLQAAPTLTFTMVGLLDCVRQKAVLLYVPQIGDVPPRGEKITTQFYKNSDRGSALVRVLVPDPAHHSLHSYVFNTPPLSPIFVCVSK